MVAAILKTGVIRVIFVTNRTRINHRPTENVSKTSISSETLMSRNLPISLPQGTIRGFFCLANSHRQRFSGYISKNAIIKLARLAGAISFLATFNPRTHLHRCVAPDRGIVLLRFLPRE